MVETIYDTAEKWKHKILDNNEIVNQIIKYTKKSTMMVSDMCDKDT